jgi:hypothetical protein
VYPPRTPIRVPGVHTVRLPRPWRQPSLGGTRGRVVNVDRPVLKDRVRWKTRNLKYKSPCNAARGFRNSDLSRTHAMLILLKDVAYRACLGSVGTPGFLQTGESTGERHRSGARPILHNRGTSRCAREALKRIRNEYHSRVFQTCVGEISGFRSGTAAFLATMTATQGSSGDVDGEGHAAPVLARAPWMREARAAEAQASADPLAVAGGLGVDPLAAGSVDPDVLVAAAAPAATATATGAATTMAEEDMDVLVTTTKGKGYCWACHWARVRAAQARAAAVRAAQEAARRAAAIRRGQSHGRAAAAARAQGQRAASLFNSERARRVAAQAQQRAANAARGREFARWQASRRSRFAAQSLQKTAASLRRRPSIRKVSRSVFRKVSKTRFRVTPTRCARVTASAEGHREAASDAKEVLRCRREATKARLDKSTVPGVDLAKFKRERDARARLEKTHISAGNRAKLAYQQRVKSMLGDSYYKKYMAKKNAPRATGRTERELSKEHQLALHPDVVDRLARDAVKPELRRYIKWFTKIYMPRYGITPVLDERSISNPERRALLRKQDPLMPRATAEAPSAYPPWQPLPSLHAADVYEPETLPDARREEHDESMWKGMPKPLREKKRMSRFN